LKSPESGPLGARGGVFFSAVSPLGRRGSFSRVPVAFLAVFPPGAGSELPPNLEVIVTAALPFEPGAAISFATPSFRIFAWATDKAASSASDFLHHETGIGLVNGYGIHRTTGDRLQAHAVHAAERWGTTWDDYEGEWSALRATRDGLDVACSGWGTEHVYRTQSKGWYAIANRARLLWALRRGLELPLEADAHVLSQLLTRGFPFCTRRTAVRGVELVPADIRLEWRSSSLGVQERPLGEFIDPAPSSDIAEDWEALASQLASTASWLRHADRPVNCALTGGKDSRLVLAAIRGGGVLDRVSTFYISAPPEHADAIVASSIAEQFDLPFERRSAPEVPELEVACRRHVAYTEGLMNGWDLKHRPVHDRLVGVHGLGGELYRRKRRARPYETFDDAERAHFGEGLDFGHIVRRPLLEWQRERGRSWLSEQRARGLPLDAVDEAFYRTQRICRWVGQGKLRDGLCGVQHNPLFCRTLLARHASFSADHRSSERTHYELMRHLWSELVEVPFARDRWDQSLTTAPAPHVDHRAPPTRVSWQRVALGSQWRAVRAWILDRRSTLAPLIAPRHLEAFVELCGDLIEPPPARSSWRTWLKHPWMKARVSRRSNLALPRLLSLCATIALHDELRAPLGRHQILV